MSEVSEYQTISADAHPQAEFVDRRSRFIAQLVHVSSEAEAADFIAQVRQLHHDARHNVPAWVLTDGRERCSDDGEPQRTAGMPVLEVLQGAGLKDVCCVVTRYFGGTLLGAGGLVRAYTAAAQQAVEAARQAGQIVTMTLVTRVVCSVPYGAYERVRYLAETCGGKVFDSLFTEEVQLTLSFKTGDEQRFLAEMRELAAGKDLCHVHEPAFLEF